MGSDIFGGYARLWVIAEVTGLVMEPFCVPDQRWLVALGPAMLLSFLKPQRGSFGLALALRIAMSAHQAPYHFDSAIWKMQTDLAVLVALALHGRDDAIHASSWVIQGQMSLFYLASGKKSRPLCPALMFPPTSHNNSNKFPSGCLVRIWLRSRLVEDKHCVSGLPCILRAHSFPRAAGVSAAHSHTPRTHSVSYRDRPVDDHHW